MCPAGIRPRHSAQGPSRTAEPLWSAPWGQDPSTQGRSSCRVLRQHGCAGIPALSTALAALPPRQRSPRSQGALWPPACPCHLSCSITPQPITSARSEGLCWCPAKPHMPMAHPLPSTALGSICTTQEASQHMQATRHPTCSPAQGVWVCQVLLGQAGHLERGSEGGLERRHKQGSALQRSQALGTWDNCPAPGCGFAQEKTKQ